MNSKTGESAPRGLAAERPSAPQHEHGLPRVRIESEEAGVTLNLGDLWAYRELLYFLTLRDIKVRYKQTLMGAAWAVIQPLMTMLIFTLVFNKFARLDTGEVPYPLFAYSGLLVWTFFSSSVATGTYSLVNNSHLVTRVYFPRLFIPAASVGAGLVDMGIASVLLFALAAYYGATPTWGLVLLPAFVLLTTALALGAGVLVSALTVKYRDLRHALPFVMQFWMFASPVIYPSSLVPSGWRWILFANPLAGAVEGFRSSVTGRPFDWPLVAASAAWAALLVVAGLYVFRRLEDTFADVI
ncbi:MAG TPA: ABC transporter permease [Pyrinomonadaceae bacterium]|nr:ABC transporter permease [Pyrinomonadaceae bacterium]